jgi:preprotein translocase subunit SecB
MPKKPLKASPIQILSQDFSEVSVQSQHDSKGGANTLDVSTTLVPIEGNEREWMLMLSITLGANPESARPSYLAQVEVSGHYHVNKLYKGDPERLVRITGASILYGAAREMICNITSRCDNGMLTLPSVSFFEKDAPKPESRAKKITKKRVKDIL